MLELCQYKNIAGKPGEGIHSARFMGLAAVDLILTFLGAAFVGYSMGFSIIITFIIFIIIGEFAHWLFCVDTALLRMLNVN